MSMILPVALATTGAAAIVNFWLALRIGQIRRREGVFVGDGGSQPLIARMRAQANFIEYTPIVLILIALVELAKGPQWWLWAVGAAYIVGRVLHGFGMDGFRLGREIGTATTLLVMIGLGIYAAVIGFQAGTI